MEIQPLHTTVDKSIQTMLGMLVLEAPNGFPRFESNLYIVGVSGKLFWKAEKPDPNTLYSRVRLNDDETISAYTISGQACELELKTGKLISFTKIS
jgi:hypothetical protein